MRTTVLVASALIAGTPPALAQRASAIRLRLDPGSELTIEGTSSLHDFQCRTDKINAYVDVDPAYTMDLTRIARPIVSVKVNIVVKTLSCGNAQMDRNMYSTLKADENQLITYTLSGYEVLDGSASPTAFTAKTNGTLVVAGREKAIDMKITAERFGDGKAVAQGEQILLLTDFGIKPPSFMFGTLKVGNQVRVKFNLKAGPELLARLASAFNVAGR